MAKFIFPPPVTENLIDDSVIGITTTVPAELIFAAGKLPLDVNNLLVTSESPDGLIRKAEICGFPRTCCAWTKGIYAAVHEYGIKKMVVVVQGDCSNTHALAERLRFDGVECIPFAFPYQPNDNEMTEELCKFARRLGVDWENAEIWREKLNAGRSKARAIDDLTWKQKKVYGIENHLWQVSASDFCLDIERYERAASRFLEKAKERQPIEAQVNLGMVGVPPIVPGIYEFIESKGGHIIYNETQRQFTMPETANSLSRQYTAYTYPYDLEYRLKDIQEEIRRRGLQGIIHYVQSFCYRRIEDVMLRDALSVPVLTIEQDRPGSLSGQIKTRLEAFVEIITAKIAGHKIF